MSELALQQINSKLVVVLAYLREARDTRAEVTMLRRAIYNAVDHNTDRLERSFLQGIIAEFEPNVPNGG